MKKLLLCAALLAMALTVSACGAGNVTSSSSSQSGTASDGQSAVEGTYSKNLDGLIDKMAFHQYLDKDSKSDMSAAIIGAKTGYRFSKDSVTIELYEYDTAHLDDRGKKFTEDARSGTITVLESSGPIPVTLSDNGKYLMIYTDNAKNSGDEERVKRKEQAQTIVKEFA